MVYQFFRNSNAILTENLTQPKDFKKQDDGERPSKQEGKTMYGKYLRKIENKIKISTWK